MGTKIISLPSADSVTAEAYFPISQDITGNNRNTYKVTAQQIATYIGQTNSTGTVNRVEMSSSDSSLVVSGSPILTRGIIDVKINSVTLDKLTSGGARNGQVLTYDGTSHQWKPIDSSNTGVTADSVQIGTILWFAASSAPIGYLECDGSSKKISDYTELSQVLGITYGALLNGGTEFQLPDLRGEFIRGWSHGRPNVDVGRGFGTYQADAFRSHQHYVAPEYKEDGTTDGIGIDSSNIPHTPQDNDIYTDYAGGSETRPRNRALLPCIKALKTVQTTTSLLNFIPKPSTTSTDDGKVLTYNNSSKSWVPASIPSSDTLYGASDYFITAYRPNETSLKNAVNDDVADGTWRDIKTLTKLPWTSYFGSKIPKTITLFIITGETSVTSTIGKSLTFLGGNNPLNFKLDQSRTDFFDEIKFIDTINTKDYMYHVMNYSGNNTRTHTINKIHLNEDGTAYFKITKTNPKTFWCVMHLLEAEF